MLIINYNLLGKLKNIQNKNPSLFRQIFLKHVIILYKIVRCIHYPFKTPIK